MLHDIFLCFVTNLSNSNTLENLLSLLIKGIDLFFH